MRTKIGPDVGYSIEEIHRVIDGPLRLVVTDAEVYWLEDGSGGRLSGPNLVGVAEAAAGIPARPRTLRQT